jgi:hypothetical protein
MDADMAPNDWKREPLPLPLAAEPADAEENGALKPTNGARGAADGLGLGGAVEAAAAAAAVALQTQSGEKHLLHEAAAAAAAPDLGGAVRYSWQLWHVRSGTVRPK